MTIVQAEPIVIDDDPTTYMSTSSHSVQAVTANLESAVAERVVERINALDNGSVDEIDEVDEVDRVEEADEVDDERSQEPAAEPTQSVSNTASIASQSSQPMSSVLSVFQGLQFRLVPNPSNPTIVSLVPFSPTETLPTSTPSSIVPPIAQPATASNSTARRTTTSTNGSRTITSMEFLQNRYGKNLSFPKFSTCEHALFVELLKLCSWSARKTDWQNVEKFVWPHYSRIISDRLGVEIGYKSAMHLKEHARDVEARYNLRLLRGERFFNIYDAIHPDFRSALSNPSSSSTLKSKKREYLCAKCYQKKKGCPCNTCQQCKNTVSKCRCPPRQNANEHDANENANNLNQQ